MKKIIAIALLVLFLFNLAGYQLMFKYLIYRSDKVVIEQINNNRYKAADLFEVKIPVHLNIENWDDFKPISGQLKFQNNCYNYAELKLTTDTMYLMCIPNHDKARLVNADNVYAKQVTDIPQSKKEHDSSAKKVNTLSEYNLYGFQYDYSAFGTQLEQANNSSSCKLDRPFIKSPGKPPTSIS